MERWRNLLNSAGIVAAIAALGAVSVELVSADPPVESRCKPVYEYVMDHEHNPSFTPLQKQRLDAAFAERALRCLKESENE